ncbi:hypothetical protein HAZT_HAZT005157 [Hyalella azteca]|uniref:Nbr1 FW domain-containing protein n=1 Tax=Hyalella azteca TaxID=294128 RepID=A0A6A0GR71_HYAAZ|nr:hypothetical protein HAZT_HAZT005157 [Hyalella azteca]
MEVDDEVEADLLRQFNCLNTSDKEVLVKELQGLLGKSSELTEQSARFYLDMADCFVKTWRVENSGNDPWPMGCRLLHTGGDRLGAAEASDPLLCLPPHTSLEVSMKMVAPPNKGLYSSKWRMTTHQGHFFGDTIWVILQVDDGGTLALMQQMMNLKELGSSPPVAPPPSPAHAAAAAATSCSSLNPFSPNRDFATIPRLSFMSAPLPFSSVGDGGASTPLMNFPAVSDAVCTSSASSYCPNNDQGSLLSSFPCPGSFDPQSGQPPDPDVNMS